MLRLAPTRIFLEEEDLRHHLARVYLRQTSCAAGYSTDRSDEDEDEDGDEDEDEDGESSFGSQLFSTYALSHSKASGSDFTSEPGSWSSQDRWQTNWRTHAPSLPSLAKSVTLETSQPSCTNLECSVHADRRAHALGSILEAKCSLTQRASRRHMCHTGSRPHLPATDTPTLLSLKSEPRALEENLPNTADKRTKRGFKPPKSQTTEHLPLVLLQELERSASLTFPFTTLNLILQHAASQRQEHRARPKATLKQNLQCNTPNFDQSTKTYAPTQFVILHPLVKLLKQICQKRQLIEIIIMDGARNPSNSVARRGVRTRNSSTWRRILQEEPRPNGNAHSPETQSAPPGEESGHRPEQIATEESPSCPTVEGAKDEDISKERARVRKVMSISSLAPAANHHEIRPLHRARISDADANSSTRVLPNMRVLDPVAYPTGSAGVFHGWEGQRRDVTVARPLEYPTVMEPPLELTFPAPLAHADDYRSFAWAQENHNPTAMYGATNAIPERSSAVEAHNIASAWPGEHHARASFKRHGEPEVVPKDVIPEGSPAASAHDNPVAIAREQPTMAPRTSAATPPASAIVHVQPFTPVNPPSRSRQGGSATPHGGHSEPNNDDEPEAEFRTKLRSIERRLKRMIANELREPDIISIYDYGLGALRRKPLGEWYREAVNKDD